MTSAVFHDTAFQNCSFLFDQTAAKVWHKLVDDSFNVYSVILPMNPLIYEWFHLSFKLKELKESIRVWVASWCLFGLCWISVSLRSCFLRKTHCNSASVFLFHRSLPEPPLQEGKSVWGRWGQHPHVCVPGPHHLPRRWGRVRACESEKPHVCWNCELITEDPILSVC